MAGHRGNKAKKATKSARAESFLAVRQHNVDLIKATEALQHVSMQRETLKKLMQQGPERPPSPQAAKASDPDGIVSSPQGNQATITLGREMSITPGLPSPGAISTAGPAQRKTRVTSGTAIISKIAQPKPAMQMGNGMSSSKAVVIITSGVGSEATCPNDSVIKPDLAQPEDDFITVSKKAVPILEQNNIDEECTKLNAGGSELDASRGADCSDQGAAQTDLEAETDANADGVDSKMPVGYTEKKEMEDSLLADNITQPTSEQATPVKGHQGTGQHFRNVIERTILGTINAGLHLAEPAIVAAMDAHSVLTRPSSFTSLPGKMWDKAWGIAVLPVAVMQLRIVKSSELPCHKGGLSAFSPPQPAPQATPQAIASPSPPPPPAAATVLVTAHNVIERTILGSVNAGLDLSEPAIMAAMDAYSVLTRPSSFTSLPGKMWDKAWGIAVLPLAVMQLLIAKSSQLPCHKGITVTHARLDVSCNCTYRPQTLCRPASACR